MLLADPSDDQLRQQISAVYERYSHFMDADLQQRAVEYIGLMKHPDVASRNVTAMPKWEKRKSLLLRRMAEKEVSGSFSGFYIHVILCCGLLQAAVPAAREHMHARPWSCSMDIFKGCCGTQHCLLSILKTSKRATSARIVSPVKRGLWQVG